MDHARFSAGLVTQSGSARQHASVSEEDQDVAQAPANNKTSYSSAASPIHISSSQSSTSSTHSSSSTTQHLRAFDPSDPTTLSIKPTTTTTSTFRATTDTTDVLSTLAAANNTSTATNPSSSSSSPFTATGSNNERRGSALTQEQQHNHDHNHNHSHDQQAADTEKDCDHRRPEEEDGSSRRPKMSSQLMSKTVTPFLKDHIPGLYSPMTKRGTIKDMEGRNKDPNSRYCYRHRPDSKCRRAADESKMVKIQQELENLKPDDQQAITHVWSLFSAAPAKQRDLMLQGIMTQCCFPQLSKVSREVADQLKIDFITALPPEDTYFHRPLLYTTVFICAR